MAGIYIHFPFCKQKCNYCNFFSVANRKNMNKFSEHLIKELVLQKTYLQQEVVKTIYFGGGTPSLLSSEEIKDILETIQGNYFVSENPEITLEANPENLTIEILKSLKKIGINRLSIGVQSFNEEDLLYLGRNHSGNRALQTIKDAQNASFSNLSVDFIYGIPTLNVAGLEKNLQIVESLHIPHISAYCLTVEYQTPLALMIQKSNKLPINEEEAVKQFRFLMKWMKAHNYQHYEISNFCLNNFYSKHNTSYWTGEKYLGIGPSAHSFNGNSRQWNISDIQTYISGITEGEVITDKESLSLSDLYNEFVMTSIRTQWGCDLQIVANRFGKEKMEYLLKEANIYIKNKWLIREGEVLFLSEEGKLYADRIASTLFHIDG